jgi:NADH:ubiquinone oxidoreductase subunit C
MIDNASLLDQIRSQFPDAAETVSLDPKFVRGNEELQIKVPSPKVGEVAAFLKNHLGFDFLNFLTAADFPKENRFEVIYHFLRSSDPAVQIFIKTDLPREGEPSLPSLVPAYAAADWQERETYDLFGIRFEGHPNHKRILLWEGYPGWPLRKDYVHTRDKYDNGSEVGTPKAPAAGAR